MNPDEIYTLKECVRLAHISGILAAAPTPPERLFRCRKCRHDITATLTPTACPRCEGVEFFELSHCCGGILPETRICPVCGEQAIYL